MKINTYYAHHLKRIGLQKNSIDSYVSDAQLFLRWHATNAPMTLISRELINQYLRTASFTRSKDTMKRKEVSLKHFYEWLSESSQHTYTINSKKNYERYAKLSASAIALLIVLSQVATTSPITNLDDVISESIDNPVEEQTGLSSSDDNFSVMSQQIPLAVSGYEIAPALENASATNVELSLHDEAFEDEENDVILSPFGGTETIEKGNTYTIIVDPAIREDSIITVTPTAPTQGQSLYVKSQEDGYAVVSLERSIETSLPFNWIVLQ